MATIPETHLDLLQGKVGAFATVGTTGHPQVTAVVAKVLDDGLVHTSVNDVRQKYKNMAARPQATFFVIDPENAYRTIEVRADVEMVPDPEKAWSKAFLGGAVDLDQIDPPEAERIHVIMTPTKVNTLG